MANKITLADFLIGDNAVHISTTENHKTLRKHIKLKRTPYPTQCYFTNKGDYHYTRDYLTQILEFKVFEFEDLILP